MKYLKKTLSLILTLMLLLSLTGLPAFAEGDEEIISYVGISEENNKVSVRASPPTGAGYDVVVAKGEENNNITVQAVEQGQDYSHSFSLTTAEPVIVNVENPVHLEESDANGNAAVRTWDNNSGTGTQVTVNLKDVSAHGTTEDIAGIDNRVSNITVNANEVTVMTDSNRTATGIAAENGATVNAEEVSASGENGTAKGVWANGDGTKVNVAATEKSSKKNDGSVTATTTGGTAIAVNASDGAEVTADSVTATATGTPDKATAINIWDGKTGTETKATVKGDVVSSGVGVDIENGISRFQNSDDNGKGGDTTVIIEGDLKSGGAAIVVNMTDDAKEPVIVVGAIKDQDGKKIEDFEGKIEVNGKTDDSISSIVKPVENSSSSVAKGIYYIVNKTNLGQNITVTGTRTIKQYDGEVAQETDEITMTADGDGTLEDVSAGDYATVTKVDNKTFKILVNRGGDLVLKGTFTAAETKQEGTQQEETKTEEKAESKSESGSGEVAKAAETAAPAGGGNALVTVDYKNHTLIIDMTTTPAQTFLTDTMRHFQKDSGVETVVIKVANGSFTMAMDDLMQTLGTAPSFTLKVAGDTLSITAGGNEIATLVMA